MSIKAIDWAKSVKAGGAGAKLALLLLADHMNEKTNECFPSIPTLAIEMECSENTVRSALKKLRERGLVTWVRRGNGETVERTDYVLNIGGGEALQRAPSKIEPPSNSAPPSKIEPPSNSEGLPLQILNPKQEVETGNKTGRLNSKAHASRSLPRATHTREAEGGKKFDCEQTNEAKTADASNRQSLPLKVAPPPPGYEDDDKQSAQPAIPEEPPFDAGLFDEAQLFASENLDSFETEVNAELACSAIDQTPLENVEILHAMRSNSNFGTNTPSTNQNAVASKSESRSKPKRRASASVERPEDVSAQAWDDWMTVRKAKRLPVTPTALAGIRREAEKAGVSLTDAITFAVEQGWAGFRADWYSRATAKSSSPASSSGGRYLTAQERYEERMRKAGEMSDEEYFAQFDLPEEVLNYEKAQEAKRHVA